MPAVSSASIAGNGHCARTRLFLAAMAKKKTQTQPTEKPQQNKERKAIPADEPTPMSNGTSPSSHFLTKHLHHFSGGDTLHLKSDPSHRHTFSPSSPFLIQTSCLYITAVRLIPASHTALRPAPPGPHHTSNIGSCPQPSFPSLGAQFQPAAPALPGISITVPMVRPPSTGTTNAAFSELAPPSTWGLLGRQH